MKKVYVASDVLGTQTACVEYWKLWGTDKSRSAGSGHVRRPFICEWAGIVVYRRNAKRYDNGVFR